jgi:hypothetical protein
MEGNGHCPSKPDEKENSHGKAHTAAIPNVITKWPKILMTQWIVQSM